MLMQSATIPLRRDRSVIKLDETSDRMACGACRVYRRLLGSAR